MKMKLTQSNFDSFLESQKNFSEALNHRMTRIEQDVSVLKTNSKWIVKLLWGGIGVMSAIFVAVVTQGI